MGNFAESPHTKKCLVFLERLEEKSLKKCLKKHGLKLTIDGTGKSTSNNRKPCSKNKTPIKRTRRKGNSDDPVLEKNYKRKRKKIRSPSYIDDEAPTNASVWATVLSGTDSLISNSAGLKSKPVEVDCDEISTAKSCREDVAMISLESEVQKLMIESEKLESRLKREVLSPEEGMVCGGIDKRKVSSAGNVEVQVKKFYAKPRDSGESQINGKEQLTAEGKSEELRRLEGDDSDCREDGEDDRSTVTFEEEFHKDTEVEELVELFSKKFKNKEIKNRKRQMMVKFKRKSMTGRNLAKIERKQRNKLVEASGSEQEAKEAVSEECLEEVCVLVKRLHELSRIILLLQRERPKNDELSLYFSRVINVQQEKFNREIRKDHETIIKCYEKMLNFYGDTDQVALEIGKRTSLNTEDVVYVIGLCQTEKSQNAGNQGIFSPGKPSVSLQEIFSDNSVRIMKKLSHMEGLNGAAKEQKVSNYFGFSSSQCSSSKFNIHSRQQNFDDFPPSQPNAQRKQQKNCYVAGFALPQYENLPKQRPHSQSNVELKKQKASNTSGFSSLQLCTQPIQEATSNNTDFLLSQSNIKPRKRKENGTTMRHTSNQTKKHNIDFISSDIQPAQKIISTQPNNQPKQQNVNSTGRFIQTAKRTTGNATNFLPPQEKTRNNTGGFPNLRSILHKQQNVRSNTARLSSQPNIQPIEKTVRNLTGLPPLQCKTQPKHTKVNSTNFSEGLQEMNMDNIVGIITKKITSRRKLMRKTNSTNATYSLRNTQKTVNKATGTPLLKINRPSGEAKHQIELVNGACGKELKSTKEREKCLNSSDRLVRDCQRKIIPSARQTTLLKPNFKDSGRRQLSQYGLSSSRSSSTTSSNSAAQQQSFAVRCEVPAQSEKPPLASVCSLIRHGSFSVSDPVIPKKTSVLYTVPECKRHTNRMLETGSEPSASAKDIGSAPSTKCGNLSGVNHPKQVSLPKEAQWPPKTANLNVSKVLDVNKLFTTPMDLSRRKSSTTTEVKDSAGPALQEVLDPTIPQKLTMRNSRLQAGPIIHLESPIEEKKKNAFNELENLNRKDSKTSRVYFCAQNECKNPGVRICDRCHSTIYCSQTCQFRHWKLKHNSECYQLMELRG